MITNLALLPGSATAIAVVGTTPLSYAGPVAQGPPGNQGPQGIQGPAGPVGGVNSVAVVGGGSVVLVGGTATITLPVLQSYLSGLQLSNNGASAINVTAGMCADATDAVYISVPSWSKSMGGAFAAGNGANGMGQGLSVAVNTWYAVFAVEFNGSADVYFDTSATGANAPVGTNYLRRIGFVWTDGSAHVRTFLQNGDFFYYPNTQEISSSTSFGPALLSLAGVPQGVSVQPLLSMQTNMGATNGSCNLFFGPGNSSSAFLTIATWSNLGSMVSASDIVGPATNTSGQIWGQFSISASASFIINSHGYIDRRGRDT